MKSRLMSTLVQGGKVWATTYIHILCPILLLHWDHGQKYCKFTVPLQKIQQARLCIEYHSFGDPLLTNLHSYLVLLSRLMLRPRLTMLSVRFSLEVMSSLEKDVCN